MPKKTLSFIITIVILFASNNIQAQLAVLHKGYIIKNSGEKISCLIREDSYNNYCEKIQYRLAGESDLKVGTPHNIKAFEIPELTVKFETFEVMTQVRDRNNNLLPIKAKRFLKHLKEGEIDLYELYNTASHSSIYYVKKEGFPLQRLEILRVDFAQEQAGQVDTLFRSKSIRDQLGQYKFKKNYLPTLSTLTADCPQVTVDQFTLLERGILNSIVQTYNECQPNQMPAQSYFTRKPYKRLQFIYRLLNFEGLENTEPSIGLEFQLGLTPSNNTTVAYGLMRSVKSLEKNDFIGSPVSGNKVAVFTSYLRFQNYFIQGSRIKPYLTYGANFYRFHGSFGNSESVGATFGIGGGVLYQTKGETFFTLEVNRLLKPNLQFGVGGIL